MKHLLITILLLFSTCCLSQKKELIYLWPGKVPGEMKEKQPPVADTAVKGDVFRYIEVTNPFIEAWPADPKLNNGAAVIVCPGGGYRILARDKEGTEIAAWLNGLGYSATGGHGYGLRPVNLAAKTWPQLAESWLKNILFPKK
ncbi:MAG: hypothetical protein A2Z69_02450 [Bacteroidetes bacterium RBG_13_44_24]|nr:MAG: hypothetical protein A2Z69_02450 [Bacteroidetes bacterium RBG_13_44_24]